MKDLDELLDRCYLNLLEIDRHKYSGELLVRAEKLRMEIQDTISQIKNLRFTLKARN